MATDMTTPQTGAGRPAPRIRNGFKISPVAVPETHGDWLYHVEVRSFLDTNCVGKCDAKLIKESEYDSDTKHFFSAMDDQSNTMGDLAQLVLWSEGRWVFSGAWEGMKEYGDRNPAREELDEKLRQSRGTLAIPIPKYCTPVLFRPREHSTDHIAFPDKRHWLLLFTDITVAKAYKGRNIDRAMVRKALECVVSLARGARRPLLAAVEPGCVQFKRFYISDRAQFEERYGASLWKHWRAVQDIKKRQEEFWLGMGFQRFEKPEHNRDLSNFFFWSGLFDLPERKDIDLTDLGREKLDGSAGVGPDGTMIIPEKRDVRRVRLKNTEKPPEPEPERRPGKRDREDEGGESDTEQRPEKRGREGDGDEVAAEQRPEKRGREDEGDQVDAEQRPEKRYRLADDMETDPVELPQQFETTDQIGDGDIFDVINWADYD